MATGKIVWNIKGRCVESGPYPNQTDADNALRKHLSKSGTKNNDKVNAKTPAEYEVLTVTL